MNAHEPTDLNVRGQFFTPLSRLLRDELEHWRAHNQQLAAHLTRLEQEIK